MVVEDVCLIDLTEPSKSLEELVLVTTVRQTLYKKLASFKILILFIDVRSFLEWLNVDLE